ncbi:MAG: carbonic anhydrase [Syntrophomonadaceae bacterium]|jgi:carbonic anhydrase
MSDAIIKQDFLGIIQDLEQGMADFALNFPLEPFKAGDYKQHPVITLLTCSDSRMPVDTFGRIFNRIFSVENIGNQAKTSAGSLLYGLLHLHTPIMIIAGHTDCGAIKAAVSDFTNEPEAIRTELTTVKNSLEEIIRATGYQVEDTAQKDACLAELNVDMQIKYLLANEQIASLVKENQLTIIGVLTDLHNVHGNGFGKTYTINVNGEHKIEVLREYSHLGSFAHQARRLTKY